MFTTKTPSIQINYVKKEVFFLMCVFWLAQLEYSFFLKIFISIIFAFGRA